MLRELGLSLKELPPTALLSDLWPFFLVKLSNWYHGTHAESKGRFTIAPKMTPNPDI